HRLPARRERILVGGLALVLAVFAALTPSRLTMAEAVVAAGLAAAPLLLRAAGVRNLGGLDRLPAILMGICVLLALNRLRVALGFLHAPDMEDIGTTTIAGIRAVFAGQN